MKSFKLLISVAFVFALLTPVFLGRTAYAQQAPVLQCAFEVFPEGASCDLAIKKEVSVNGGAFTDANTAGDAVAAFVGDVLTWKVSVANESTLGGNPEGTVRVSDLLPAGVSFVSATASDGTYDNSTGTWEFTLTTSTTYPVTLLINTTAASEGTAQNTAAFDQYDPPQCDENCNLPYGDFNPENNSDDAFANISTRPVVLAASTTAPPQVLAETSSSIIQSIVAAGLIVLTLVVIGYSRYARKTVYYSPFARKP